MAAATGKRKREDVASSHARKAAKASATEERPNHAAVHESAPNGWPFELIHRPGRPPSTGGPVHVQIVTGSYERILHGISATIPASLMRRKPANGQIPTHRTTGVQEDAEAVTFSDTFLFAAHTSSIRCLALSPPTESDKRLLATGGSDERINIYNVSTTPPTRSPKQSLPAQTASSISENPENRSLGSLIHHDRAITRLRFSTKAKLFSAAEDNTIAISRTRDWTVLSSIKAPIPKVQGRPSGDTAGPGETPAGVNDFAIHPSQKLMLSVGRAERCMRLWNLMTGKKAGVLNFDRELLTLVGEGKYHSGEGRRVLWDEAGEMFVVGFERGAAVFGIDSKPRAVIRPVPPSKMHQMQFLPQRPHILSVSMEDGRILFFDASRSAVQDEHQKLPSCSCIAQLGGLVAGVSGRIKDFEVLEIPATGTGSNVVLIVTASSDGTVRLWTLSQDVLAPLDTEQSTNGGGGDAKLNGTSRLPKQVGELIGSIETGNRITCMGAFTMDGKITSDDVVEADDADVAAAPDGDGDDTEDSE